MSETVSIQIANRSYTLKPDTGELEALKAAQDRINRIISDLEKNYAVSDKQDLLAMCLIQVASELERVKAGQETENEQLMQDVKRIISNIEDHINKHNVL